jgi:tRNA modification GTPase
MPPLDDTIVAIASPPGGAARGIVRLSGPEALDCAQRLLTHDGSETIVVAASPCVIRRQIVLPVVAAPLPADVYVWPTRRSYTGQPVVELHTLGSPPLLEAVVSAACRAGARLAEPGEFTLRAFLAGRLDLTQAEAVLGAIDAADRRQLDTALRQLAGGLTTPLGRLRQTLLELLADLEAGLDFADEDIRFVSGDELTQRLTLAAAEIDRLGERLRLRQTSGEAPRVVLVGRPNAGKSSLFNALSGLPRALVSRHAGTTRDYLVTRIEIDGIEVELIDTPGRDHADHQPSANDALEPMIRAAAAIQAEAADVELLCRDATSITTAATTPAGVPRLIVWTKCDAAEVSGLGGIRTSSLTGEGVDTLRAAIREAAVATRSSTGDTVASTAIRCCEALERARVALGRAIELAASDRGEELVAMETRSALDELGRIVGAVYTEDLLESVFSRFCIGK